MKEKTLLINITNKGAIVGIHQMCLVLSYLTVQERTTDIKTLKDSIEETKAQLKKMVLWLDRKDDKTISKKEIKQTKEIALETLKMFK